MSYSTMNRLMIIFILGLGLLVFAGMHPAGASAAPIAAPATAPLHQAGCTLPATVTTAGELSDCITEANANGVGSDTITLGADITLSAPLPQITSTIVVEGAGYYVDGNQTYRVFYVASTGDLTINQITVQNGVTDGVGGGIYNAGTLTVTSSTIANNSALGASGSTYGGGIYNDFGTLTVTDSTISGNYADTSGGGIGTNGASSTVTVTNSTISGNSADVDGGGIYNFGTLTVTNSTLADNHTISSGAGGIANFGTVHLAGVILDTGTSGPNCENYGTFNNNGYNLSDDASCGFTGTSTNNATLNLGALSGGVHTPQAGSDAIGVIPNGTTVNNNGVTLACNQTTTDQLGADRPIVGGDSCASGAVEVVPPCVLPATVTTETQLARCITAANANGAGLDTITLGADITLSAALPQITSAITLEGGGFFVDGANTYRVFFVASTGDLTVNQITAQNGAVSTSDGGGIFNNGTLTVTNSTFSGNFSTYSGGGIANESGGTLTVTNSTFSGNNASTGSGGGIFNFSGTATVTNSTFSGNNAPSGGGISTNNTAYLSGVILDTGTSGANCSGTMTDNGYNLSDDASCGFTGTSADDATLNLGALSGGVHTPLAGSAAIGAIPNGTTVNNNGVTLACNNTTTDQLGSTRPIVSGDACTSGAVEVSFCPTPLAISDTSELANCITWANTKPGADTLGLDANITLSADLPQITSAITLEGGGFVVDGDYAHRAFYVQSAGDLTVNQITVWNVYITGPGGIFNDGGTLTLTNSSLSSNRASRGGGIFNNGGTVTLTNSTLSSNRAVNDGGGIYNFGGTVTVTNSTLSSNAATGSISSGGGIYNDFGGTVTVTHSTFSGNDAYGGAGGIYNVGTTYLAGVILDTGTGTSGANCENFGTLTDNGYNLSDDASCGFTGTGSANNATLNLGALSGGVHIPADPSDAIGAIPNGITVNNNGVTLACNQTTTDQLGADRPINAGAACASGAVEVAIPPLCPTPLAISDATELANCITWANGKPGADTLGLDANITLSANLPQITSAITLEGGGFFVSGANAYRVFWITSTGDLTINQITVQNGYTTSTGGGIYNDGGTLTVTHSTIRGNRAYNGGGIYNLNGTLTVTNSTISGNDASDVGGGIYNSGGTVTLTNSTLSSNRAVNDGGGIYNSGGTLTVTNSTLSSNSVSNFGSSGGGIYNTGTLTVTHTTFSGNNAESGGGGIYNSGAAYLAGVIMDTGTSGVNCQNIGTLTDNGYNLSDDTSCGFTGTGSANNATLNLGALSGGVHTPQAGSAAIGVIPNGTTVNNNGVTLACNGTTTDQLGSTRPINLLTDCTSGAVEVAMPPLCPTPLAISDTTELANCITWANANPGADTLGLDADITLSTVLPQITTEITLEGGGFFVDGANTYRVFWISSTGDLTINQITVQNGRIAGSGGGILNDSGTLTVTNSTLSGNFASGNGGGIANFSGGTLTVTNSTFSGNSATIDAGGILNANGTATVTHSTFSGNSGINAGAILNTGGTVYLAGVILDTGPSGANCQNIGTLTDNGYNLSDDASCGFTGTSADDATLNLGALSGGVHTPAAPSAAIAAIPNGTTVNNNGVTLACNSTTTDQLGNTRPIVSGGDCTSGAVEIGRICAITENQAYSFGDVTITIQPGGLGTIQCLQVNQVGESHPQATPGIQTGEYWQIDALDSSNDPASGYTATLTATVSFVPDADDKLCRYTGSGWDCAASGFDGGAQTITRENVTQFSPWAAGNSGPLAVTLASFAATVETDHIRLTWETVSEVSNAGFNLYRTGTADPPTASDLLGWIPSQGPGSTQGFIYSYQDDAVTAGEAYWYWLEDVALNGATALHDPVSVVYSAPTAVTLTGLAATTDRPALPAWPWMIALLIAAGGTLAAARWRLGRA